MLFISHPHFFFFLILDSYFLDSYFYWQCLLQAQAEATMQWLRRGPWHSAHATSSQLSAEFTVFSSWGFPGLRAAQLHPGDGSGPLVPSHLAISQTLVGTNHFQIHFLLEKNHLRPHSIRHLPTPTPMSRTISRISSLNNTFLPASSPRDFCCWLPLSPGDCLLLCSQTAPQVYYLPLAPQEKQSLQHFKLYSLQLITGSITNMGLNERAR